MEHLARFGRAADPPRQPPVAALACPVLAEDDVQPGAEAERLVAGEAVDVLQVADLPQLDRPVGALVGRQVGRLKRRQLTRVGVPEQDGEHLRPRRLVQRPVAEQAHQPPLPGGQLLGPVEDALLEEDVPLGHQGSFSERSSRMGGKT